MSGPTGCGERDEHGDICGETYTCGKCRLAAERDRLRVTVAELTAALKELEAARAALARAAEGGGA